MLSKTFATIATAAGILLVSSFTFAQEATERPSTTPVQSGYADVNGLHMYYEIHGEDTGTPLVVLHGAYMSINTMSELVSRFAETRQVIAVELQGHGRTADVDRPFSYEQLADDVAALMDEIGVEHAVELFRLRGGGVNGDLAGLPNSQLAVIPGATHISVLFRTDLLVPMTLDFLAAAPTPAAA